MKKMLFVYNPLSGTGVLKPKLPDVIDLFVKSGYEVTVYPTQKYRDACEKILSYTAAYDVVVCSGGDGTLDEVVTGMVQRKERVPVGYIPAGTTNDFASSLRISKNIMKAADTAANGKPFSCDVGKFNTDYFVYIAAFGLFTDVSYQTNQDMKNMLGSLAYLLEGTKRIFNVPSYKMKVAYEGGEIEDSFLFGMVTNSKSVGGFRGIISKNVAFDDGVFEVTLIRAPKNVIELNETLKALLTKQVNLQRMYSFRSRWIEFTSEEEIPWTLDGEFGGDHSQVRIENMCQILDIMVDQAAIADLEKTKELVRLEEEKR